MSYEKGGQIVCLKPEEPGQTTNAFRLAIKRVIYWWGHLTLHCLLVKCTRIVQSLLHVSFYMITMITSLINDLNRVTAIFCLSAWFRCTLLFLFLFSLQQHKTRVFGNHWWSRYWQNSLPGFWSQTLRQLVCCDWWNGSETVGGASCRGNHQEVGQLFLAEKKNKNQSWS